MNLLFFLGLANHLPFLHFPIMQEPRQFVIINWSYFATLRSNTTVSNSAVSRYSWYSPSAKDILYKLDPLFFHMFWGKGCGCELRSFYPYSLWKAFALYLVEVMEMLHFSTFPFTDFVPFVHNWVTEYLWPLFFSNPRISNIFEQMILIVGKKLLRSILIHFGTPWVFLWFLV